MTDDNKRTYIEYLSLKNEMRQFEENGYELYMADERTDPGRIAGICVFDTSADYRRSVIEDPSQGIRRVIFEKVIPPQTEEEKKE